MNQRGSTLLSVLPFILITISLCISLSDFLYSTAQVMGSLTNGIMHERSDKNDLLRQAVQTPLTACHILNGFKLCPARASNNFRDFTPLFSVVSGCGDLRRALPPIIESDDIVSIMSCYNPLLRREVESFRANLILTQDAFTADTKLLTVLGETLIDHNLQVTNSLLIVSGGSIVIESLTVPNGVSVTIISTRSIHVKKIVGRGEVLQISLKDPAYQGKPLPLLPIAPPPLWSLQKTDDTPA